MNYNYMRWLIAGLTLCIVYTISVISTRYQQSSSTSQEVKDKLILTIEKGNFRITYADDFIEFMLKDEEQRQKLLRLIQESQTLSPDFRIKGVMIGRANIEKDGLFFEFRCFDNSSSESVHYMVIYVDGEVHGHSTLGIQKEKLLPHLKSYKK